MSTESSQILDVYEKYGLVRKHEWPILPNGIGEQMPNHGQYISFHDCLMINRNVSTVHLTDRLTDYSKIGFRRWLSTGGTYRKGKIRNTFCDTVAVPHSAVSESQSLGSSMDGVHRP